MSLFSCSASLDHRQTDAQPNSHSMLLLPSVVILSAISRHPPSPCVVRSHALLRTPPPEAWAEAGEDDDGGMSWTLTANVPLSRNLYISHSIGEAKKKKNWAGRPWQCRNQILFSIVVASHPTRRVLNSVGGGGGGGDFRSRLLRSCCCWCLIIVTI